MRFTRTRVHDDARSTGKRPWLRRLGFLALLLALVYLAPAIVAGTPLLNHLVKGAVPALGDRLHVEGASLGWFSSVRLRGIHVLDDSGEVAVRVPSLTVEASPLRLMLDRQRLGTITVQQPEVRWRLRPGGSNLEELAKLVMADFDDSSSASPQYELLLTDGSILVQDQTSGEEWNCRNVSVSIAPDEERRERMAMRAEAEVTAVAAGGKLTVAGSLPDKPGEASDFNLRCESVPLSVLRPLLKRCDVDAEADGSITCVIDGTWNAETGGSLVLKEFTASDLTVISPTWLKTDRLAVAHLGVQGKVSTRDGRWSLQDLFVNSELARIKANGTMRWDGNDSRSLVELLRQQDVRVNGDIDVARLATMLPATFRMREDTHLVTGHLRFGAVHGPTGNPENPDRWEANLTTIDFAAERQGHLVRWEQPIDARIVARQAEQGLVFELLECRASFGQVSGAGTPSDGALSIDADLSQLTAELRKFFDVGSLKLDGRATGKLGWQRIGADQVSLSGTMTVSDFLLESARTRPWNEQRLDVMLSAIGRLVDGNRLSTLETGFLRVNSGSDMLDVQLLNPIADLAAASWPLSCRVAGDLETWAPRLQTVLPLGSMELAGRFDATTTASISKLDVQVDSLTVGVENLTARGGRWNVAEPVVRAELAGQWSRPNRALRLAKASVSTSAVAFRADGTSLRLTDEAFVLEGDADVRADLERLHRWMADPRELRDQTFRGMAVGKLAFAQRQGETDARWDLKIDDFAYLRRKTRVVNPGATAVAVSTARPDYPVWQEKQIQLTGRATLSGDGKRVTLADVGLNTDSVQVAVSGTLDQPTAVCDTRLEGQLAYDWDAVTARLAPYLGTDIRLLGRGQQPIRMAGPLFEPISTAVPRPSTPATTSLVSSKLTASAGIDWQGAEIYGLQAGEGSVQAKLVGGTINVTPVNLSVSGGSLNLVPRLSLNQDPPLLTVAGGPVVTKVNITPPMCRSWLKYVAPLVAEATEANGSFSLELKEDATIPLPTPATSSVKGVIDVHEARVGPGPLARECILLALQVRDILDGRLPVQTTLPQQSVWLNLPPQQLAFQVVRGRVYHKGLVMQVKDVVVRTEGSVGLDQSLSMLAEVPIRDEWLEKQPLLATLKGQSIRLGIQGTLTNPRLDRAPLQDLGKRVVGGAANRLLEDQINRGLNKLFGPQQQQQQQ